MTFKPKRLPLQQQREYSPVIRSFLRRVSLDDLRKYRRDPTQIPVLTECPKELVTDVALLLPVNRRAAEMEFAERQRIATRRDLKA